MTGVRKLFASLLRAAIPVAGAFFLSAAAAGAEEIKVSRFGSEGLAGWEEKRFTGRTEYQLLQDNGTAVIKATSHSSASGMIRKISFDPAKFRYLRWSWKISHTIAGADERAKSGDDYAARLYVIFPGRFFWQMRALNYVWANRVPKGEYISSPYTSHVKILAVESGNARAGKWLSEECDIAADFLRLFGEEPPPAEAIAIMSDTDNTGSTAEAWFGAISLSTEKR